jgi:hypothetical protein
MNVENSNIESLYMAITCISFLVFVLNVVIINWALKIINVSCDDNVVTPLPAYSLSFQGLISIFGKTSISSWLNFYLSTKLFSSLVKPLFLSKTFLLHG